MERTRRHQKAIGGKLNKKGDKKNDLLFFIKINNIRSNMRGVTIK